MIKLLFHLQSSRMRGSLGTNNGSLLPSMSRVLGQVLINCANDMAQHLKTILLREPLKWIRKHMSTHVNSFIKKTLRNTYLRPLSITRAQYIKHIYLLTSTRFSFLAHAFSLIKISTEVIGVSTQMGRNKMFSSSAISNGADIFVVRPLI